MEESTVETSAAISGAVLRLRHEERRLLTELTRVRMAVKVLTLPIDQVEAIDTGPVVTVPALTSGKPKRRRRTASADDKPRTIQKGTVAEAIRMALVKLKQASGAEVFKFVKNMGVKTTKGSVYAALSIGMKAGEYLRVAKGVYKWAGGIARGTAQ